MAAFALLLLACDQGPERAPAIAEAYVGPVSLNLREDIPLNSPVVATVKHGDRLEIVGYRRRFMKVRTRKGAEGWTSERMLLSKREVADLQQLAKAAKTLPSQGVAKTFDKLNMHIEPNRHAPSFLVLQENQKVEVLARRVEPRVAFVRESLIPPHRSRRRPPPKKPSKRKGPALPMPPTPGLPANWLELSKTSLANASEAAPAESTSQSPQPVRQDEWSLVRTAGGETTGWVLTRRLYMAIPDEVAQYAEGNRITSYFSLGEVLDGDKVKHNWLWTTSVSSLEPYDFDSVRVFIWSLSRHRFETAFVERKLKGYYPVRVHPVEYSSGTTPKKASVTTTYPGFSICVEKEDGRRFRREYAFVVNRVRYVGERPCEPSETQLNRGNQSGTAASAQSQNSQQSGPSFFSRLKRHLTAWRKRWFGK